MKSIKEADVKNKKVLLRVDFNVPLKDGVVVDDFRIKSSLPTIKYLIKNNAVTIILAHLGRPKGKVQSDLKLDPVAERLSELLNKKVIKTKDCVSLETVKTISDASPGDIIMLENLRFNPGEENNDSKFAEQLAHLGDIYVNNAFSVCHRKHASIVGIPKFLPHYAGFELEKEVTELSKLFSPKLPFVIVLGGVKISTKIGVIKNLINKADKILIGGAMVFTFFKAQGLEIGSSKFEADKIDVAKKILDLGGEELVFPSDIVLNDKNAVPCNEIPADKAGLDIGPDSCFNFSKIISNAKTVFWNGPMGLFEKSPFDKGTNDIASAIANSKAFTIAGGGETISAIRHLNLENKFSFISTGGGASLEFLAGKELPGIEALEK